MTHEQTQESQPAPEAVYIPAECEAVRMELSELRIQSNLAVLDGLEVPDSTGIEELAEQARALAESINQVSPRFY
jgi:hypothetical protein